MSIYFQIPVLKIKKIKLAKFQKYKLLQYIFKAIWRDRAFSISTIKKIHASFILDMQSFAKTGIKFTKL